jgi:hypothetical protein
MTNIVHPGVDIYAVAICWHILIRLILIRFEMNFL